MFGLGGWSRRVVMAVGEAERRVSPSGADPAAVVPPPVRVLPWWAYVLGALGVIVVTAAVTMILPGTAQGDPKLRIEAVWTGFTRGVRGGRDAIPLYERNPGRLPAGARQRAPRGRGFVGDAVEAQRETLNRLAHDQSLAVTLRARLELYSYNIKQVFRCVRLRAVSGRIQVEGRIQGPCLGGGDLIMAAIDHPVRREPSAMADGERLWTVEEVAEYLGVPVSTLYGWRHRNLGPRGRRIGKHLRYRSEDVLAWVMDRD